MMYGYGYHHALGPGLFGGLFSFIFWVAVIWFIVRLFRNSHHCQKGGCDWMGGWQKTDSAMDILRERYAKGEISKEEFEERKEVLKNL